MNLVNICGFAAVTLYVATLVPTNFCIVFPDLRQEKIFRFLFKNRRSIGLITFTMSCIHAAIYLHKIGGIDLFALNTYHTYFTGLSSLGIFAVLSITSNNWSIKKFKKNWKTIHKFTYVALFLLLWHIWTFMAHNWSLFTLISLWILSVILVIYVMRLSIDFRKRKGRSKKTPRLNT